jgi:hypothetical protein
VANTHSLLYKSQFHVDFKPWQALDFDRVLHAINPHFSSGTSVPIPTRAYKELIRVGLIFKQLNVTGFINIDITIRDKLLKVTDAIGQLCRRRQAFSGVGRIHGLNINAIRGFDKPLDAFKGFLPWVCQYR